MLCMINGDFQDTYDKLSQELRRGILVLATLSQMDEQMYGYALISHLAEKGLEIDQGTLYPLLRRLEEQGMLDSSWDVSGSRPRRYYVINANGKAILEALTQEWKETTAVMDKLLANAT